MATRVEIAPTRLCDVWAFAGTMRPDDVAEVAALGLSPAEAVLSSWQESEECWSAWLNGELVCIFGLAPAPGDSALVPVKVAWALSAEAAEKYPITYLRVSRDMVQRWQDRGITAYNFVDARYTRALRWAAKIGFVLGPTVPYGQTGEPFQLIMFGGE